MVMICPYCDMEINEKQMEAEDGCCPECGALITAGTVINEGEDEDDEDFFEDDEFNDEYGEGEFDDMDDLGGMDGDDGYGDDDEDTKKSSRRRRG